MWTFRNAVFIVHKLTNTRILSGVERSLIPQQTDVSVA